MFTARKGEEENAWYGDVPKKRKEGKIKCIVGGLWKRKRQERKKKCSRGVCSREREAKKVQCWGVCVGGKGREGKNEVLGFVEEIKGERKKMRGRERKCSVGVC